MTEDDVNPFVPNVIEARHTGARPRVNGKFICVGEQKIYVRGVTYGPSRR